MPSSLIDRLRAAVFRPLSMDGVSLSNRIVMSPMTRNFATDGVNSEEAIDYYRRRAAGGTGLILTEGVAVSAEGSPGLKIPDLASEAARERWRQIVDAVHAEKGRIMIQLWHAGILRGSQMEIDRSARVLGPSGLFPRLMDGVEVQPPLHTGDSMTERDIENTIADCARFGAQARDIGFDGLEIHAAHGYLWDQFFWDKCNKRSDKYNGGIAERTRFAVETISAIKRAAGSGFPIGLRFSQWKLPNYYDIKMLQAPSELEAFLKPLADAGVSFFDCSTRRYWEPAFPGSALNLAGWTRKLTGVTSMTVGSIGLDGPMMAGEIGRVSSPSSNLEPLIEALERGDYDLVGVGRALIANPDWALHIANGETDRLKPFSAALLTTLH